MILNPSQSRAIFAVIAELNNINGAPLIDLPDNQVRVKVFPDGAISVSCPGGAEFYEQEGDFAQAYGL